MTYCKKGLGLSAGAQVHVSGHVGGCLGLGGSVMGDKSRDKSAEGVCKFSRGWS